MKIHSSFPPHRIFFAFQWVLFIAQYFATVFIDDVPPEVTIQLERNEFINQKVFYSFLLHCASKSPLYFFAPCACLIEKQIIEKVADEEFGEPKDEEEDLANEARMRPKIHCGNLCCFCWPAGRTPAQESASKRGSYKKLGDTPNFAMFEYPKSVGKESWPEPLCKIKPAPAPAPDVSATVASALHKEQDA